MRHRLFLASIFALLNLTVFSQVEIKDSLSVSPELPENTAIGTTGNPNTTPTAVSPLEYNLMMESIFPYTAPYFPGINNPDLLCVPGRAELFNWDSGEIVATGGTNVFPGMMQIDSGTLGIYRSLGAFTVHVGGKVNKYGYFNGLHTQYGLNGSISYQFNPRLSATIFGEYYFGRPPQMANGLPMPPSMLGYYGRSTYGISFDYHINERWGVKTGVQTVQQVGTNKHRAEPILTPYYKISKKISIGLPVGQILYHILKK